MYSGPALTPKLLDLAETMTEAILLGIGYAVEPDDRRALVYQIVKRAIMRTEALVTEDEVERAKSRQIAKQNRRYHGHG